MIFDLPFCFAAPAGEGRTSTRRISPFNARTRQNLRLLVRAMAAKFRAGFRRFLR
jgi:hypothetical protein